MKHVVVQIELLRLDGFPSDADARAGQPSRRPKNHHVVYGIASLRSLLRAWRRDERAKHAPPPGVTTHPDRQCDPNQHPRAAHQRERLGFHSTGGLDARRRVFVCRVFVRKRSAFRPSSRRPVRCGRCLLSSLDGFAHRSVSSLVVVYVHHPKRRSFRRRRARFRLAGQARLGEKRRNRRSPTDDII